MMGLERLALGMMEEEKICSSKYLSDFEKFRKESVKDTFLSFSLSSLTNIVGLQNKFYFFS